MDVFDEDLIGMVNFTDETVYQQMPVMEQKNDNANYNTVHNAGERVKRVAENCDDCPFVKKRSLFDRLRDMAKWLCICGGICMLMWWFEMNGLMATEAARPFTFVCGGVGFFGAGMNFRK